LGADKTLVVGENKKKQSSCLVICSIKYTVSQFWNRGFLDGKDLLELCARQGDSRSFGDTKRSRNLGRVGKQMAERGERTGQKGIKNF
jgi:hypothetical protein